MPTADAPKAADPGTDPRTRSRLGRRRRASRGGSHRLRLLAPEALPTCTAERYTLPLDDPRWREVILLCAGHLDTKQGDDLIDRALGAGSEHEELLHRDVLLASTIVAEDTRVSLDVRVRVHEALVALLTDPIPAVMNTALSGIVSLARLGLETSINALAEYLERGLPPPASALSNQPHLLYGRGRRAFVGC